MIHFVRMFSRFCVRNNAQVIADELLVKNNSE